MFRTNDPVTQRLHYEYQMFMFLAAAPLTSIYRITFVDNEDSEVETFIFLYLISWKQENTTYNV